MIIYFMTETLKGGKDGSPKRFHFVRGHVRRLSEIRVIPVKAHWKGDPRLGLMSLPEYKFKDLTQGRHH